MSNDSKEPRARRLSTRSQLLEQQRRWAVSTGLTVDGRGYVTELEDNLFQPMSARAASAFAAGGGSELLGRNAAPPKMQALHSSAALAVNVFDYWSEQDLAPIGRALGLSGRMTCLQFEMQFPTGLGGTPPNLDLAFTSDKELVTGVESKFTEWLTPKLPGKQLFKEKYLPKGDGSPGRWATVQLPRCQALAEDLDTGKTHFRYLDAAQLLKHVLGMATLCAGRFSLYYVYFDFLGPEGSEHVAEVLRFQERVGSEVGFQWTTYQAAFARLSEDAAASHYLYLEYLRTRYFAPVHQ